jgi:hypothetical protein
MAKRITTGMMMKENFPRGFTNWSLFLNISFQFSSEGKDSISYTFLKPDE